MLSAPFIHFCRRIGDADILLNFRFKIIFRASNRDTEDIFFIAARKRFDWVVDLVACSSADLVCSTTVSRRVSLAKTHYLSPKVDSFGKPMGYEIARAVRATL
jgi:hypothetical protein